MKKRLLCLLLLLPCLGNITSAQETSDLAADVPSGKRTVLGLYVTAKEAYAKWKADPRQVKVLDCRTPEEYAFVGHPAMAGNLPLMFVEHKYSPGSKSLAMKPNPDFVQQAKQRYKTTDTILITCRSGGRSAQAVNLLAEAGFKKAYTIIDGFEGDTLRDPQSPFNGKRAKNGWKNSEIPWTYEIEPDLVYAPRQK